MKTEGSKLNPTGSAFDLLDFAAIFIHTTRSLHSDVIKSFDSILDTDYITGSLQHDITVITTILFTVKVITTSIQLTHFLILTVNHPYHIR